MYDEICARETDEQGRYMRQRKMGFFFAIIIMTYLLISNLADARLDKINKKKT